jgi:hypothetical protein
MSEEVKVEASEEVLKVEEESVSSSEPVEEKKEEVAE